jgi:hypothetical protein
MNFLLRLRTTEAKVAGERLRACESEMNSRRKEIHREIKVRSECKVWVKEFPQGSGPRTAAQGRD